MRLCFVPDGYPVNDGARLARGRCLGFGPEDEGKPAGEWCRLRHRCWEGGRRRLVLGVGLCLREQERRLFRHLQTCLWPVWMHRRGGWELFRVWGKSPKRACLVSERQVSVRSVPVQRVLKGLDYLREDRREVRPDFFCRGRDAGAGRGRSCGAGKEWACLSKARRESGAQGGAG